MLDSRRNTVYVCVWIIEICAAAHPRLITARAGTRLRAENSHLKRSKITEFVSDAKNGRPYYAIAPQRAPTSVTRNMMSLFSVMCISISRDELTGLERAPRRWHNSQRTRARALTWPFTRQTRRQKKNNKKVKGKEVWSRDAAQPVEVHFYHEAMHLSTLTMCYRYLYSRILRLWRAR